MSLADAFAGSESDHKERVLQSTWGHLKPECQTKHQGSIIFAWCEYGGHVVIVRSDFPTVADSPWFYQDMLNYAVNKTIKAGHGLYKFVGTYTKFKNGKCKFSGRVRNIDLNAL